MCGCPGTGSTSGPHGIVRSIRCTPLPLDQDAHCIRARVECTFLPPMWSAVPGIRRGGGTWQRILLPSKGRSLVTMLPSPILALFGHETNQDGVVTALLVL